MSRDNTQKKTKKSYRERQAEAALELINAQNPDVRMVAIKIITQYPYVEASSAGQRLDCAFEAAKEEIEYNLEHLTYQAARGKIIRGMDSARSALNKARLQINCQQYRSFLGTPCMLSSARGFLMT